jgi:hypothetical protein
MRNEKHRMVAAAVKAATRGGSVLVLSSADSQVLASPDPTKALLSQELAGFECKSCVTRMTASSDIQPFCISCGSDEVEKKGPVKVKAAAADSVGVECASCSNVMVLSEKIVTAAKGHVHCSTCGTALRVKASGEEERVELKASGEEERVELKASGEEERVEVKAADEWPFGEADIKSSSPEEEVTLETDDKDDPTMATTEEIKDDAVDVLDQVEASDEWPFGEEDVKSNSEEMPPVEETAKEKPETEDKPAPEAAVPESKEEEDLEISLPEDEDDSSQDIEGELTDMEDFMPDDAESDLAEAHSEMFLKDDPVLEEPSVVVPGEEAGSDSAVEMEDLEEGEGENYFLESSDNGEMTETPPKILEPKDGDMLADALEMDDTGAGVEMAVTAAGRLVAMKGHVAIASLTRKAAKENAEIMDSAVFQAAIMHQVKRHGLRAGLHSMGFEPIRVPTLSKATIARHSAKIEQAAANREKKKHEAFASAFAIASVGLARGRWKGYTNDLRAAVEQQLQMAGVKNARSTSARLFEAHAVTYSKSLLELASKLAAMSEETRQEMAESLEMTTEASDQMAPETQHDDISESPELATVDARLMSTAALLRPGSTRKQIQASVTSYSAAQAILDGTASLSFE